MVQTLQSHDRQVHLDFHTSPYIDAVGADFDADEFADRLVKAHVNSITLFARDHHGYLFYPSKRHPEIIHPHLTNHNLLIEQIDACHKRGIRVPVYSTVEWDEYSALRHPEWLARDPEGNTINGQPMVPKPNFYESLCLNSNYREYLLDHINDIIDTLGPDRIDGLFLDIFFLVPCDCERCQVQMKRRGMDHTDIRQREAYCSILLDEFKHEVKELLARRVPGATIFFNGSHIGPSNKASLGDYSHLEIESLPGGTWGYDNFPIVMKYVRNLGKHVIGMTGKFHTYWGDFHSLKNINALEYECFQMLTMGAGCSIGDQLHPKGKLSDAAYDLIGKVYSQVEDLEPVTQGTEALVDVAVMTPEREWNMDSHLSESLIGANRMLTELGCQFDIIDPDADFGKYRLIVLPDEIVGTDQLRSKLEEYVHAGGKVIGTYMSLDNGSDATNELYGNSMLGESYWDRDFIMPNDTIGKDFPKEELVMYERGARVQPEGSQVLLESVQPYFNREGKTFCSHQHAPSTGVKGFPAATRNGGVIYFSHPLFRIYRDYAPLWVKDIFADALNLLLPDCLVKKTGEGVPSSLELQLRKSESRNSLLLHCLYYPCKKQAVNLYTIDEKIPLYDQEVKVKVGDASVKSVTAVRSGEVVDPSRYSVADGYLTMSIPKINGYEIMEIALG
ncbi:beta-galactosidase trimerization domain-containing protein [Bifidobacterium sp. ESL0790]|uniref:beta-galactosidase trimerization domain-containing protein n=1 Tax=Bifidobacterium sp. ESL0790 TaxID=2983233 RepID=UPI0023F9828A|nr:beta-galactosidase trimerization domain-containing protein [Bifidobacterium sp. ESL0790]WEV72864.1 beta-galactosidase trimerization domain-containing protein [Bifidobacterium sp. ESL0790]